VTRRLVWLALGVAAAIGLVVAIMVSRPGGPPEPAAIGGPFQLIDQSGRPVDQSILKGKWSAVFFGYTYCPDVCPTDLAALGRAQDALGARAKDFQVVFITVDPERDTPKALAAYLSSQSFPKGAIGLTGDPSQIRRAADAYHVFYQKHPEGGTYTMDHSAATYLMDAHGRFVKPLDLSAPPADVARQIAQAMQDG